MCPPPHLSPPTGPRRVGSGGGPRRCGRPPPLRPLGGRPSPHGPLGGRPSPRRAALGKLVAEGELETTALEAIARAARLYDLERLGREAAGH